MYNFNLYNKEQRNSENWYNLISKNLKQAGKFIWNYKIDVLVALYGLTKINPPIDELG